MTGRVITRLERELSSYGFERHKHVWNRRSNVFVDVIDLQISKAGDTLTVNVGVLDPEVHRITWQRDPPRVVEEAMCTVRARVGELAGAGDLWWPVDDVSTPETVATAVVDLGLPFLNRMHDRHAMMEFMDGSDVSRKKYPPSIVYLAILKDDAGDRAGACRLLSEVQQSAGAAWRLRVEAVAAHIGCV